MTEIDAARIKCETCKGETRKDEVDVTMWLGSELNVIEGVPAHVCDRCELQYYDTEVEEAIRALAASGFPAWKAVRHISVPVFTLLPPKQSNERNEKPAVEALY
jgi:YgiT-type zinc finger domain-containing protein